MASQILVNIVSGTTLLPDGTKPSLEPLLRYQTSKGAWKLGQLTDIHTS